MIKNNDIKKKENCKWLKKWIAIKDRWQTIDPKYIEYDIVPREDVTWPIEPSYTESENLLDSDKEDVS